jgi:hypothetical protein
MKHLPAQKQFPGLPGASTDRMKIRVFLFESWITITNWFQNNLVVGFLIFKAGQRCNR